MLQLQQVSKTFSSDHSFSLEPVSLNVARNELLVILGSSGSGKSTLLKLINRLLTPTSGQILFEKRNVNDYDPVTLRHSMGYVFQGIGLLPHLTVADNISTVPHLRGVSRSECNKLAAQYLEQVNLDPATYAQRLPHELSGGQQQRVGVARALATEAELLLMDEPFGALDAITRDQLQQELLALKHQLGKTIVFVTHDIFEALTLADRIVVLHNGQLQQVGSKQDIINKPATEFVRELFQKPLQQIDKLRNDSTA